jgi:hypothetical protein
MIMVSAPKVGVRSKQRLPDVKSSQSAAFRDALLPYNLPAVITIAKNNVIAEIAMTVVCSEVGLWKFGGRPSGDGARGIAHRLSEGGIC